MERNPLLSLSIPESSSIINSGSEKTFDETQNYKNCFSSESYSKLSFESVSQEILGSSDNESMKGIDVVDEQEVRELGETKKHKS